MSNDLTDPTPAEVAKEIDRLVVGVNRQVMVRYGGSLRGLIDPLGLDTPGHLMDLAEFFLADRATEELASRRFPCDALEVSSRLFRQLRERELIDGSGHPSAELVELLGHVVAASPLPSSSAEWPSLRPPRLSRGGVDYRRAYGQRGCRPGRRF